MCYCSFRAFFGEADSEEQQAVTGSHVISAEQQHPAVIVLLPLLLGLGKVWLDAAPASF